MLCSDPEWLGRLDGSAAWNLRSGDLVDIEDVQSHPLEWTGFRLDVGSCAMSRCVRIGLSLLLLALPLAGLRASPSSCGDGIRSASSRACCCCADPAGCFCQAPAAPEAPTAAPTAVPASGVPNGDATAISTLVPWCSLRVVAYAKGHDAHALQAHPEELLTRLQILQV